MILRILTVAYAVFMTPSLGNTLDRGLSEYEFDERFEEMCFQKNIDDPYKINGQENPLANTLDNFIAFAERFEELNPMTTLREEIYYFLRNYLFENIKLTKEGAVVLNQAAVFTDVDKLFEPDTGFRERFPEVIEPFSDDEKCSLYYMISHSVVDIPIDMTMDTSMRSYSNGNDSIYRPNRKIELKMDDYFPQEIGVVAIPGSDAPVSLSRVLMGLYVGINPAQNRKKDISTFDTIINKKLKEENFPQERMVDPLYTLTMAEVLMMAAWSLSEKRGLLEDGKWAATPLTPSEQIEGFCPMVYKQEKKQAVYSYSSIRGAADGLILGMVIYPIQNRKPNSKLSQILRMYYSRDGVPVEQGTEDVYVPRVSFCNRMDTLGRVDKTLESQMELYGLLVSNKLSVTKTFTDAKDLYSKSRPFQTNDKETKYCRPVTVDKPEELPKETFLDVFVLMDSSVSEGFFQTQQRITGYLASYMDLRNTGSRMTILLDQKITTSTTSARIELKPVVEDSYSSSYVACTVGQIAYEQSSIERDLVISAIDQLLEERKSNESQLQGTNGKVVIYYNFETDDGPRRDNNRIQVQGRLDKALQDFFRNQQDATVYAVGLDTELLKKYARNDPNLVFLSADGNEKEVAQKLHEKLTGVPSLLQYPDCKEGRTENSATYENFVSPLALQHWQMPARYFYKSIHLKVAFESQNGPITVCHNRATMKPENEARNCLNTSATSKSVEFKISNPCKSFTKETCSPFYFSIMGMPSNGDGRPREYCNDINGHWCSSLNDIKFKVSHQGIRCSGCLGLVAPPIMVLLTVLLSYILNKAF